MEQFLKAVGVVLLAVVLVLILRGNSKGVGELLSILVCCMVAASAISCLRPVIDFIRSLESIVALDSQMLKTMLKVVSISVTAEIAALLCDDAGSSAMGKSLQFLAAAVILCLSLPVLTALLELIEGIMGLL